MARYVSLIRFTDQGVRHLSKSPVRALAFRKAAEKSGVKVEVQLWTLGKDDGLLILSGEERKVLRVLAQLAALGNVRTRTMPAYDAAEFQDLAGK
jgi:uncharacterized protein with GYD domain